MIHLKGIILWELSDPIIIHNTLPKYIRLTYILNLGITVIRSSPSRLHVYPLVVVCYCPDLYGDSDLQTRENTSEHAPPISDSRYDSAYINILAWVSSRCPP